MEETWTAQVYVMTGRRWEGPYAVTVTGRAPTAARRAVQAALRRLTRPRVRISELRVSLQRTPTPAPQQ